MVPSISFPVVELNKITGALYYEERMLFMTLLLRAPELRLVYVTSLPLDPAVVDYYLSFTPDPEAARSRLHLLAIDDPDPRGLSEKLLERPDAVDRLRELAGDPAHAYVLTFNVTPAEAALVERLGLPLYGPHPDLVPLGSKTGSREVAQRAGVAVLDGSENVRSMAEIEAAIAGIRRRRPQAEAVVVKLNDGFSGQGNAIVELAGLGAHGPASRLLLGEHGTTFCAAEESWRSFEAKVVSGGAVVEELVRHPRLESPSVQLRVTPAGDVEVISTHDQVLGGPENHVYLGCRFPADPSYRAAIQEAALRVGRVLAGEGVLGSFGIDFLVVPGDGGAAPEIYLSEINLRLGGTTHPFWMARLVTDGTYRAGTGDLVAGGRPKFYVASDNLKSTALVGRRPAEVIEEVARAGLAYDRVRRTGTTLHLLGPVEPFGKMGATCIGDSPEEAEELYQKVSALLL